MAKLILLATALLSPLATTVLLAYPLTPPCNQPLEEPEKVILAKVKQASSAKLWAEAIREQKKYVSAECGNEARWLELAELHLQAEQTDQTLILLESLVGRGFEKIYLALERTELPALAKFVRSEPFKKTLTYQKVFALALAAIKRKEPALLKLTKLPSKNRPGNSVVAKTACPLGCCVYGEWTSVVATKLAATLAGKPSFPIEAGQKFTAVSSDYRAKPTPAVIITDATWPTLDEAKPGHAKDITLLAGELLFLLEPIAEGVRRIWYQGKTHVIETFAIQSICHHPGGSCWAELLEEEQSPIRSWWVKLRDPRGKKEWWTNEADKFSRHCEEL